MMLFGCLVLLRTFLVIFPFSCAFLFWVNSLCSQFALLKSKYPLFFPCLLFSSTFFFLLIYPKLTSTSAKNRRYVIDQDLGAVAILNDFPFLDKAKPNGTSSTNILRVESGQIRYIHEITVCSTANCGR